MIASQADSLLNDDDTWRRTTIPKLVEQQNELFKIAVMNGYTTETGHKGVRVAVRGG